jgi:hypothetical protein
MVGEFAVFAPKLLGRWRTSELDDSTQQNIQSHIATCIQYGRAASRRCEAQMVPVCMPLAHGAHFQEAAPTQEVSSIPQKARDRSTLTHAHRRSTGLP